MRTALAAAPKKGKKRQTKRRAPPKRRSRGRQRRILRRAPPKRSVLDRIVQAFTPQRPYDEQEAVVDALSGKEACPHGRWPHEGGLCALCAGEVALKVASKLFGS